jgi:hypothetical protein
VRTGIVVIAFGFVIEKFNLFVLAMAQPEATLYGDTAPFRPTAVCESSGL